jgi:hypothetical protein
LHPFTEQSFLGRGFLFGFLAERSFSWKQSMQMPSTKTISAHPFLQTCQTLREVWSNCTDMIPPIGLVKSEVVFKTEKASLSMDIKAAQEPGSGMGC